MDIETILQHIAYLPLPAQGSQPLEWLQWLALAGGALAGIGQVLGFVFGIWMVSAAGSDCAGNGAGDRGGALARRFSLRSRLCSQLR